MLADDDRDATRDVLARVSVEARGVMQIAAVLGECFSFDHVAAMLDAAPASLLGPVEELVFADLLTDDDNQLAFAHDRVRREVIETIPISARPALHRQAIEVLLQAGASPLEPAILLAESARIGDRTTIAPLRAAARALGTSDADAAADISRRAYDLTAADDGQRGSLAAETALLLHAADRAHEGKALVDATLRGRLAPEQEAELLMSIARMSALPAEVCTEAGHRALELPGLNETWRTRHQSQLVYNVLEAGRPEVARQLLPEKVAGFDAGDDQGAALVRYAAESRLAYMNGAFRESVYVIDAARFGTHTDADGRGELAEACRAEALVAMDDLETATETAADRVAAAQRDRQTWAEKSWRRFHGRCLLQAGRIADAAACLDGTLTGVGQSAVTTTAHAAAVFAIGRIAIHTGDRRTARVCAAAAEGALQSGAPEVRRQAAWFLALHALAGPDAASARSCLPKVGDNGADTVLPLLMVDIADPAQLVRVALAAGDDELARSGVAIAEARRCRNPGVGSLAAVAAHARGLFFRDVSALAEATGLFSGGPRPLARASALEDYGIELVRDGHRAGGIEVFGDALETYTNAGATWDAARVRGRLRDLGVRRRLVHSIRPTSGWAALTEAEIAVVRLVAEGLTNRQVAERLFVSPHTVSMHLRHAFTKCDINSRVELTRLVLVNDDVAA